jgi:cytochrome c peroxidase
MKQYPIFCLLSALGLLAACGDVAPRSKDGAAGRTPWEYASLAEPAQPADNVATREKIVLGRLLFHDPILSGDRATACVTCHSQYWGMGDGLKLGIGVGGTGPAGIGRRGAATTRRNVPTLWNVAYRSALFWDGRTASLEDQVEVPLFDKGELGSDPATVMRDVASNATYAALFAAAFPADPSVDANNLARAMASFVRTIFTNDAPYDRYAVGDDRALAATEVRGMFRFAELGCATCHVPPLFAADRYDAVTRAAALETATSADAEDEGRFEVTGDERDRGAFRVPQLRNLRETGPYFHDGHAPTIRDAVREMATATSTGPFSEEDVEAIAEFVGKGLMDKSHAPERPIAVPSGLPVPADGFTIRR